MSWHYLRVLEGEFLEDICLGGEQCVPLKSKITHAVFYCNGKLMDSYLDSLSGTMLEPLTENLGKEKSMLSAVDSHARTSVLRGGGEDLMVQDQDYGAKWQELLARYNPLTHSWRTLQCSLFEDLELSLETFPRWGMTVGGELFQLQTLVQFTKDKEFGYWPTPTASDWKATGKLETLKRQGDRDGHQNRPQYQYARLFNNKMPLVASEMMMLWPLGWTDLKPLAMDKSLCVQQQHGES